LLRGEYFKDADSTALLDIFPPSISQHARAIMHTLTAILTLISLHLLTFPDLAPELTYGYQTLTTHTPATYGTYTLTQRYWLALGATLLVFTMSLSPSLHASPSSQNKPTPLLQTPFNTRIAQYLGKISFGLYIVHLFVIYTINSRFILWTAGKSAYMYFVGFAVSGVVSTVVTMWAADLFWRVVDVRSVEFAKRVGAWCFVK
jgi:peptidoglycan/LPS O-acetylase OafA/YrhL